jgi:hypothetical protein
MLDDDVLVVREALLGFAHVAEILTRPGVAAPTNFVCARAG